MAAGECERRLAPVLCRKLSHHRLAHIRRIRHDEIVATRADARVEVRSNNPNPRPKVIVPHVTSPDLERSGRNIRSINPCVSKGLCKQNRKARGACAEIEHVTYLCGIRDPWPQVLPQKLRNIRARHDHALIDVETIIAQPRLMGEISGGFSSAHALFDQCLYTHHFSRCEDTGQVGCGIVRRQVKRVKNEPCCFVPRVCRAVPEADACRFQAAR